MFYSIGIDIAKDNFQGCLLAYDSQEQTEKIMASRKFDNTPSGHKEFAGWAVKKTKKIPAPVRCTMEATGVYHEHLAVYIKSQLGDWALSVVLASQGKKFIQAEGLRSKTDKIDAHALALMGARKRLGQWKGIDPFWSKLRQFTRARGGITEQVTALNNQLHALQHSPFAIKETEAILKSCMRSLQKQQQKLEQLIEDHLRSNPDIAYRMECMQSIMGVGLQTVAVVLGETLGFVHFSSKNQLISYCGYDVKLAESGKYSGKPKISKMGNARIRKAMYMPVGCVIRFQNHPYHHYYARLLAKHDIKMKAHVAVQKKILSCMYFLWKKQEMFDPRKAQNASGEKQIAPPLGEATVDTAASPRRSSVLSRVNLKKILEY